MEFGGIGVDRLRLMLWVCELPWDDVEVPLIVLDCVRVELNSTPIASYCAETWAPIASVVELDHALESWLDEVLVTP